MSALLKIIQEEFNSKANNKARASTLKFVPDAVKVYGVRNPIVNEMAKKYKEGGFVLVKELWTSGAFEEKLLAAKMLRLVCKKDPGLSVQLVGNFSKDISDWAVCDTLGMQSLKPIAKLKQKEIFDLSNKLIKSKDLWERRLSLVLIEVYTKDRSLHPEIRKRIKMLENDKEYYVKKAVEWLNRNLKKGK